MGTSISAARLSSRYQMVERAGSIHIPSLEIANHPLQLFILIGSILFSVFSALSGSDQWDNFLKFFNASPFGVQDPLFQRDIGFYVFQLPFLQYLYGWLMAVLMITCISTGSLYFIRRAFLIIPPRTWQMSPAGPNASDHSRCITLFCRNFRGMALTE